MITYTLTLTQRRLNLTSTLVPALLLAPLLPLPAQSTWKTLADFECGPPASINALAKDAEGNLYAAISTSDENNRMHAQIRKSSDQGVTWAVIDTLAAGRLGAAQYQSLSAHPGGHLYAAGYFTAEDGTQHWLVRKSGPGGMSWATVDDFALPGGQRAAAQALTVDANGHVYVVGFGDESMESEQFQARTHWLVRHSRDRGQSWTTIDDFADGFSAKAAAVLHSTNGLFVAGSGRNGNRDAGERWLVRKGTVGDHGSFRWQTVDDFQLQKVEPGRQTGGLASDLALDAKGNLYAVGRSYVFASDGRSAHWVVRRASSTGTDWAVVDTFQLREGHFAAASGVASAGRQGVYVVGRAADQTGAHWIVRHSATGAAGSWSVSDHFTGSTAKAVLSGANLISRTPDGSLMSSAAAYATGLAIVSDATGVLTGGSVTAETSHALVRKLEFVNPTKLAATGAQ
ncbi:MAG: hypothetical protein KIS67_06245 [Verrucomicrobiae bacterium]|nr:hypothetical protein [Verrucomicrobiae bacterium]